MSCDVRSCEELSSVVRLNCHYSLNNYSVLQSTTPRILCTSKYYSNTTPVLLQHYSSTPTYYSVLQSTTPVLQRTTKYDSSTTPVLQSTTPVLLCTTKYYSYEIQSRQNPYTTKMHVHMPNLHVQNPCVNLCLCRTACANPPCAGKQKGIPVNLDITEQYLTGNIQYKVKFFNIQSVESIQ